ncbi:hypothetical protein JCM11641_002857 [Rhodosporidiobolus odoratus]
MPRVKSTKSTTAAVNSLTSRPLEKAITARVARKSTSSCANIVELPVPTRKTRSSTRQPPAPAPLTAASNPAQAVPTVKKRPRQDDEVEVPARGSAAQDVSKKTPPRKQAKSAEPHPVKGRKSEKKQVREEPDEEEKPSSTNVTRSPSPSLASSSRTSGSSSSQRKRARKSTTPPTSDRSNEELTSSSSETDNSSDQDQPRRSPRKGARTTVQPYTAASYQATSRPVARESRSRKRKAPSSSIELKSSTSRITFMGHTVNIDNDDDGTCYEAAMVLYSGYLAGDKASFHRLAEQIKQVPSGSTIDRKDFTISMPSR